MMAPPIPTATSHPDADLSNVTVRPTIDIRLAVIDKSAAMPRESMLV
jgi:hypothetical protein